MMAAVPPALKQVQPYIKIAVEHDKRDPVVSYYCRLYAVQEAIKVNSKSPDCRKFLLELMDRLEELKKTNVAQEAISNQVVGQAHLENYALRVFSFADNNDRAGNFNKNVVKSFYTASLILEVLSVFGELTDEVIDKKKYSKWKAAYIHNCLKEGQQPVAGPVNEFGEPISQDGGFDPPGEGPYGSEGVNEGNLYPPTVPPAPPSTPSSSGSHSVGADNPYIPPPIPGGAQLTGSDFTQAGKLCKFASSALMYEDAASAIDNLEKALRLLKTGKQ